MPRNRLTRAGSAGAARAIPFDGASARPGLALDRDPAEAVAGALDPPGVRDVGDDARSRRGRRARRAGRAGSRGRAPGSASKAVSHSGMLDVERDAGTTSARMDERFADLEDRVAGAMPRRRAEPRPGRGLGAVAVLLDEAGSSSAATTARRVLTSSPATGPSVRRPLPPARARSARVRRLELVGPEPSHEAAGVVPVEVRRDQERRARRRSRQSRVEPGQIEISGPEPASTSTVRPCPGGRATLTGPS